MICNLNETIIDTIRFLQFRKGWLSCQVCTLNRHLMYFLDFWLWLPSHHRNSNDLIWILLTLNSSEPNKLWFHLTMDANVAFSEHKTKDFIVEPKPLEEWKKISESAKELNLLENIIEAVTHCGTTSRKWMRSLRQMRRICVRISRFVLYPFHVAP